MKSSVEVVGPSVVCALCEDLQFMKFHTRVLSGSRPVMKEFRLAEQIAKLVYARSKTSESAANLSRFGVTIWDCP